MIIISARWTFQGRRWTKNELPHLTSKFWKMNSSNSGTGGCGAGPLNLSVYKAYKKISLLAFYYNSVCDS